MAGLFISCVAAAKLNYTDGQTRHGWGRHYDLYITAQTSHSYSLKQAAHTT